MDHKSRLRSAVESRWLARRFASGNSLWPGKPQPRSAIFPNFNVVSLGGNRLIRLKQSLKSAELVQRQAARSLGLRKKWSYSVIDTAKPSHRESAEVINRFIECSDLGIYVPIGKYRFIGYMGGIFLGKGNVGMEEIKYGVDKARGSRFFESRQGGEYLQWIPRGENAVTLVWTMGHMPVSSLIELIAEDFKNYNDRLCGMVEYDDGETVALYSSRDILAHTKEDARPLKSFMVGFSNIVVNWLNADQVDASAPVDSEYDQASIVCHSEDCEQLSEKWLSATASPALGKNAVRIAKLLGSN